ncbi:hypothetical protein SAMN06295974_3839 [Plantibacter flavus]|uniref:Uncharacterized protein n=1 Tax=Plantibacter flavus TaxID=150123 RepID=A0A3N2BL80_9MICO|nr:hypothetical protein [Plantibacter flavus]ROR76015.1 hypothetical protein EDD42_3967 [Plantibacter flavus]SMG49279.1 hypothetical protein SAMN06295974_3839 [Plantibacter flavus]
MSVWILLRDDPFGNGDIQSVHSSQERADAALLAAQRPGESFTVEEWPVDGV